MTELNDFLMKYNKNKLGSDKVVKVEKKSNDGEYLHYLVKLTYKEVTFYQDFTYHKDLEEILEKMNSELFQVIERYEDLCRVEYDSYHFDFIYENILEKNTKDSNKYEPYSKSIGILNIKNKLLSHIEEYNLRTGNREFKELYKYCMDTFYASEKYPMTKVLGV